MFVGIWAAATLLLPWVPLAWTRRPLQAGSFLLGCALSSLLWPVAGRHGADAADRGHRHVAGHGEHRLRGRRVPPRRALALAAMIDMVSAATRVRAGGLRPEDPIEFVRLRRWRCSLASRP